MFTKECFQITSLHFGTSRRLRDKYQGVPKLGPEDEGNIFPETKFLIFKTTRLRCSLFWYVTQGRVVVSEGMGRHVNGQAWSFKIRPICFTETSVVTSLRCVTSLKFKPFTQRRKIAITQDYVEVLINP